MLLINCKIKLNLTWKKECVLSTGDGEAVFIINDTKLYVPVVTLSKEENKDFIEEQNKGFQRSIYWNEYKTKEINEDADANVFKYINLDPSFQGVNRLFVMAYNRANGQPTRNGRRKYYLPRIDLEKYNVIIDGRNFYDNPIESDIEKYRELKKVMIGKGEDYTTGSLLDFNYFDKHYKLVAVDLSKQKELDADPRAIQQIDHPDCIIFFICVLLNFISVAELLLRAFLNLVFCLVVNNNSCGVSSLLKFLIFNLSVAPSLDLTAFFTLFNCTFVNLQSTLLYSTIIYKSQELFNKFCELNFSFNIL